MKHRLSRWLVRLAALFATFLIGAAILAAYWRMDKTEVFLRTAGNYAGHDVLAEWTTAESTVRLIGLRNHRGEEVTQAYVRRSDRLEASPRIVVIYAGAKTGDKILKLIPERENLVLVAMQYPYESPEGLFDHLRWPLTTRRAAYRAVAGGMLAVSFLSSDERLELDRLIVVGSSLGSLPATILGALDERVPTVLLVHGGGHLPTLLRANIRSPWVAEPSVLFSEVVLDTFDPLHWVDRISPRKLVMIAAENDTYFPPESAQRLFDKAAEPKQIHWTRTAHVRSRKTELVTEIVRRIDDYLDAQEEQDRSE